MQAKRFFTAALAALSVAAAGAHEAPSLGITDLSVTADTATVLTLRYTIDPARFNLGTNRELTITPVVYSDDSTRTAAMPAVIVAGRTRYLRYVRSPRKLPAGAVLLRSGHDKPYTYTAAIDFEPWESHSTVAFDAAESGCCGAPERRTATPVARIDIEPREYIIPEFIVEAPVNAQGKVQRLSGQAFIDFHVNKTEIDPGYRNNTAELRKIMATIDVVRDNPDATIDTITIKGFASPEGSYARNVVLARDRSAELTKYIRRQHDFSKTVFFTDYEPEDWAGFRDSMQVSFLPNRDAIMELIDSDMAPDAKDHAIRTRFPNDYKYIKEVIYPALRHSDYTVRYTVRTYTDIDEIRRVMHERPGNLSLQEFHKLASTYAPGTPEYDEVFDIAVRVYPDDPVSNINAASVAIDQGRWDAAEKYLSRAAGRPEVPYLRGIMAARKGELQASREILEGVRDSGTAPADAALSNLDDLENMGAAVNYIDDSSKHTFTK